MIGYIYIITNKITGKQYVGQTRRTITIRFNQHKTRAISKKDNMYLHIAMNKYGVENFTVKEITHIEFDDKNQLIKELNALEKHYIKEYSTLSPNGYNLTPGGDSIAEHIKQKIDEYDLYGNFIMTHDSAYLAGKSANTSDTIICMCCKGKIKFAMQRIWRYHGDKINKYALPDASELNIALRDHKKILVDQYSIQGKYITTFSSIAEAYKSLNLDNVKSHSHISECCNGKLSTAHGYIWRYHGENIDTVKSDQRFKMCEVVDLEGNVLGKYKSLKEAALSLNLDYKKCHSHIVSCCKGTRKSAYGYKWKYIES